MGNLTENYCDLKDEQIPVVLHDEGNIIVSASAGSGKTFVMIQRAVRLIKEGKARINNILAVTFTELAASEMKEKLKNALLPLASSRDDIAEQLNDISNSDICTLHAFCVKIIRKYFFVVSLSPDFTIADESVSDALKHEALNKTFKNFYEQNENWFLTLTNRFKKRRNDDNLKEIILKTFEFADSEAKPDELLDKYKEIYTEAGFEKILYNYKQNLNAKFNLYKDILNNYIYYLEKANEEKFIDQIKIILQVLDDFLKNDIYFIKNYIFPSTLFKLKNKLNKNLTFNVQDIRLKLKTIIEDINKFFIDKEIDKQNFLSMSLETEYFTKVIKEFSLNYSSLKREENVLDFSDLEHFALKILHSSLSTEIKNKYNYIFIDEYQDINGVQNEIISTIENNNVFMVGDVKQSIYNFRGCKPELFLQKFNDMQKFGEKTANLNYNFRSAKNIVDFVNKIFCFSMTKEFYGLDYFSTSMLRYGELYKNFHGRVCLHHFQKEKEERKHEELTQIYDISADFHKRQEEIPQDADTAFMVANIIKEELTKTYYDIKEKVEKPIKFSDIVLLSRTNSGSDIYPIVKGLINQGFPVNSEIQYNVCEFSEVQLLIYVLNLIDCFIQDVPLCLVMKSPIGNFSEEELAQMVLFYKNNSQDKAKTFYKAFEFYILNKNDGLKLKLTNFKSYFEKVRFLSDYYGAKEVLDKIISDSDYENCLLASPYGEQKVKRIRKFLIETKKNGVSLSVKSFIKKIELSPKSFMLSNESGDNSIKAMTIHASKGLEFPVVILCGLEKAFKKDKISELMLDRNFGIGIQNHEDENKICSETVLRGLINLNSVDNSIKENLRLFYVALTRAKYSIHLTFSSKNDNSSNTMIEPKRFLNFIPNDLEVRNWSASDFELQKIKESKRTVLIGKSDKEIIEKMEKNFSFSYPYQFDTFLPLKTSVTQINENSIDKKHLLSMVNINEEYNLNITNAEKGIIAHKILQNYDFNLTKTFEEQLENLIQNKVILKEEIDKIDIEKLKNSLSQKIFLQFGNCKIYREKEFLVNVPSHLIYKTDSKENILVQGIIDFFAIKENYAVLIDYKYSTLNNDNLKLKYKNQINIYAYAIEKILNIKVKNKYLLNLLSGETIEII